MATKDLDLLVEELVDALDTYFAPDLVKDLYSFVKANVVEDFELDMRDVEVREAAHEAVDIFLSNIKPLISDIFG